MCGQQEHHVDVPQKYTEGLWTSIVKSKNSVAFGGVHIKLKHRFNGAKNEAIVSAN
jgi:hypothetical protein